MCPLTVWFPVEKSVDDEGCNWVYEYKDFVIVFCPVIKIGIT